MKRMAIALLVAGFLVSTFPLQGFALQEAGDVEVSFAGAYWFGIGDWDGFDVWSAGPRIGYYWNQNFETSLWVAASKLSSIGGIEVPAEDGWAADIEVLANFHFPLEAGPQGMGFDPYGGLAGGFYIPSGGGDPWFIGGAQVGLKYFFTENLNIFVEGGYRQWFDAEQQGESSCPKFLGIGLGLSYIF